MRDNSRAQTTLDFGIGISIFLAVILFIFTLIPGLIQPFTSGGESDLIVSQRAADKLSNDMLGSTSTPFMLDVECTSRFFQQDSPGTLCKYSSGSSVQTQLGIDSDTNINITISGDVNNDGTSNDLCWDNADRTLREIDGSGGCVWFRTADSPPAANSQTVKSEREVSIRGKDAVIQIVVW